MPLTTDSRHGWRIVPNLARGMVPSGLDQLWVADITYVRLQEEFAYLAVMLDAFSRRVIGWALDDASAGKPGDRGADDGARGATADARQPDPSLRPRRAVRLRRLHRAACSARHCRQHEPGRQSLRQRQGGELHEDAQARGGRRHSLPRCASTPAMQSAPSSSRSTIANGCTRRWTTGRQPSSKQIYRLRLRGVREIPDYTTLHPGYGSDSHCERVSNP